MIRALLAIAISILLCQTVASASGNSIHVTKTQGMVTVTLDASDPTPGTSIASRGALLYAPQKGRLTIIAKGMAGPITIFKDGDVPGVAGVITGIAHNPIRFLNGYDSRYPVVLIYRYSCFATTPDCRDEPTVYVSGADYNGGHYRGSIGAIRLGLLE
jgi:hypothetical protein